jgi:SAM-dependent methyltransferase
MSQQVFHSLYADLYDHLYHDKDYEAECDLIEAVFRRHAEGQVKTILDLGCGTGNHALPLALRGYGVTGVDRSSEMLASAQEKLAAFSGAADRLPPVFHQGDVRILDLGEQFDAVLMMFAVLSYQLTNEDVLAALGTVRRHLKPGGLFVADVWYGPAVLAQRPSDRIKVIPTSDGQVIRAASATLETLRHLAEVHYHLWHLKGDRLIQQTQETHQLRYFFPQELAFFLTSGHFKLIAFTDFSDFDRMPSDSTWNALIVGQLSLAAMP